MAERSASTADYAGELTFSSGQGRWVVAVAVLGSGMAMIDGTVVGIALPTIGGDFHASIGSLQWVVTGYTLTLAALLLLGGSLGDRLGRKKVFMIGIAWFAVASILCGVAPNVTILIVMRSLQGLGSALLTPGSLAIIQASFRPEDRARAIGAWSGLGGLAAAAGPVLGGYLISAASWRLIFYINVPIAVLVLTVAARHVPESHDPTAHRVDLPGATSGVVLLAGVNYLLIEGSSSGWSSSPVIAAAVVTLVATGAFFVVERSVEAPMLPFAVFRDRQFSTTNAVTFVVYGALGGALFLLPIELQVVEHYSPLRAGLALLPVTAIMLVFSARSGRLASRIGPRLQMSVGPLVVAAGFALLVRATWGADYVEFVLPAVAVFGAGLAITVAPLTSTAMSSAPAEHAGVASAVNNDVARVASLVAVAILPAISGVPAGAHLRSAQLASGFRTSVLIAACLCAAGGVLAAAGIRNPRLAREPQPELGVVPKVTPVAQPFACALDAPALDCVAPGPTPRPVRVTPGRASQGSPPDR